VSLPYANLPHLWGRFAHGTEVKEKPLSPIPYEWQEMCVSQDCIPRVLLAMCALIFNLVSTEKI